MEADSQTLKFKNNINKQLFKTDIRRTKGVFRFFLKKEEKTEERI